MDDVAPVYRRFGSESTSVGGEVEKNLKAVPIQTIVKIFEKLIHQRNTVSSSADSVCCSSKSELKDLHQENGDLRLRVKAIDTISDILYQTKKELEIEKNKNLKLDLAVQNLQSRLYRVGCNTTVDLAESEIFIPGHDRAFVNSLISENGKLLKELNELKKSGSDVDTEVESKIVESLRNQLREATDKLQACLNKVDEQKLLLKSSDDIKTVTIVHLEDVCQRSNNEVQKFREVCGMLTSETKQLQDNLSAAKDKLEKNTQELLAWKEKAKNLETKVVQASFLHNTSLHHV
jgi:hypothetical protein